MDDMTVQSIRFVLSHFACIGHKTISCRVDILSGCNPIKIGESSESACFGG